MRGFSPALVTKEMKKTLKNKIVPTWVHGTGKVWLVVEVVGVFIMRTSSLFPMGVVSGKGGAITTL